MNGIAVDRIKDITQSTGVFQVGTADGRKQDIDSKIQMKWGWVIWIYVQVTFRSRKSKEKEIIQILQRLCAVAEPDSRVPLPYATTGTFGLAHPGTQSQRSSHPPYPSTDSSPCQLPHARSAYDDENR